MANDTKPVRRRWVAGESADYKTKFIKAVEWLKENDTKDFPSEDPRSFLTWKKLINVHATSCKHGGWHILPWHRLYLLYFENACRYALQDKNFALPYWDWTQDRKIPSEFFEDKALSIPRTMTPSDEIASDFSDAKVIRNIIESDNWISMHSAPPDKRGFLGASLGAGAFESGPHNGVHTQVGGIMGDAFLAPEDPIFWLHHSNIDRLWADWQQRFPSKLLPNLSDERISGPVLPVRPGRPGRPGLIQPLEKVKIEPWETAVLELRLGDVYKRGLIADLKSGDATRAVSSRVKVEEILSIQSLGYGYDTIPFTGKGPVASRPGQRLPLVPKVLAMDTLPGTSTVQGSSLTSIVDLKGAPSSQLVAAFIKTPEAQATLQVSGLVAPETEALRHALRLRFFIAPAGSHEPRKEYFNDDAFSLSEYLGVYTFFGKSHDHGNAEHSSEQSIVIDATSVLRNILLAKDLSSLTLVAVAVTSSQGSSSVSYFKGGSLEIGIHLPTSVKL
jgi:hypothetical protein